MKNLMNAANINTTDSWPTMSPCVKDKLWAGQIESAPGT